MSTATTLIQKWEEETLPEATIIPWEEDIPKESARLVRNAREDLEAEVKKAATLLELQPELSTDLYSAKTLDRAVKFLGVHVLWMWNSFGIKAPIPVIGPGPDGSVDLYWKRASWELLVNIPAGDKPATFYGDDYGRQKTKGSFDPGEPAVSIAAWLMI